MSSENDPDWYWKIVGQEARALAVTQKLSGELAVLHTVTDPVASAFSCLLEPMTEIFIKMHTVNAPKTWLDIDRKTTLKIFGMSRMIGAQLADEHPYYTDLMYAFGDFVKADNLETQIELNKLLQYYAIQLYKLGCLCPLFCMDDFMGLGCMEPNFLLLKPDFGKYTTITKNAHDEVLAIGRVKNKPKVTAIVGELIFGAGWPVATKYAGQALHEGHYLLIPKHFKQIDNALRIAQRLKLDVTHDQVVEVMLFLYAGHEFGHGIFPTKHPLTDELATDKYAVLATLKRYPALAVPVLLAEFGNALEFPFNDNDTENAYRVSAIWILNFLIASEFYFQRATELILQDPPNDLMELRLSDDARSYLKLCGINVI